MAGIGFKLKKMLMEDTYSSIFKAYLYSVVISSGPWLLSILCLSLLGILSPILLQQHGWSVGRWEIFGATIVYIFAFSLITTGLITLIISRFIADKIYLDDHEAIPSTYVSIIAITVIIQGIIGIIFFSLASENILYIMSSVTLYITVSCIWITLIFLSISENYNIIISMFLIGSFASIVAALIGGKFFDLPGFLSGYTLGQVIIFFGFSYDVFSNFGTPRTFCMDFFSYCKKYHQLIVIGFLYYIAVWSDKFIFWFSDSGKHIYGLFYTFNEYDYPLFLAYLTIIPSLAIFLLNIETDFYREYRAFYEFVMAKKSFKKIHEKKVNMQKVIKRSLFDLFKAQGIITFIVIYFAPIILKDLRVTNDLSIQIFRYTSFGAFLHAYILIISIILLYYDLRKDVLLITSIFAGTNIILTLVSKSLGPEFYGLGQAFACLITFIISLLYLKKRLNQLEYLTFIKQPIISKHDDSAELRAKPGGGYGKYIDLDKARANVKD
jgi:uncharacterized membrane protein